MTNQLNLFTFTIDQITQALTQAWQDSYVVTSLWDDSLTYIQGTWQYALPENVRVVRGIYTKKNETSYPEPISTDLYEIVGTNIQFRPQVQNFLTDNTTLYLKSSYKLLTADSLPTENMINYVLSLATFLMLKQLSFMKVFVFLRNDTSLADIINTRKDIQMEMLQFRQALQRDFEGS
jgi:hypothetical protein